MARRIPAPAEAHAFAASRPQVTTMDVHAPLLAYPIVLL